MRAWKLHLLGVIACLFSPFSSAYLITTDFSTFDVLNEQDFFARYSLGALVTDLYDRGDNAQPNSWIVRGHYGGGQFWEDVSFGYERGLSSPYPIRRVGPENPNIPQPTLTIMAPDMLASAVPLAVYTDQGFFGIVPTGPQDKFYSLRPAPGDGTGPQVTTIFGINTVEALAVPEPSAFLLLFAGLIGWPLARRLAGTRAPIAA